LISTSLVHSDWNRRFGTWKGKKHGVRFGGRGGLAEIQLEASACSVGVWCFGAAQSTMEISL